MTTATSRRKRLEQLEAPAKATERRGVLVMPPILPLGAWKSRAVVQQAALAAATQGGHQRHAKGIEVTLAAGRALSARGQV